MPTAYWRPACHRAGRTILGDLQWLDTDPDLAGIQYGFDDLGNRLYDPSNTEEPDQVDNLYDSGGNDHIVAGGGDDVAMAIVACYLTRTQKHLHSVALS